MPIMAKAMGFTKLRQILEKQNGRTYSFEEAKGIGAELLDFYEPLLSIQDRIKRDDGGANK